MRTKNICKSAAEARAKGHRLFNPGKPCKHGNVAPRYVIGSGCNCEPCKQERRDRAAAWNKANVERYAATQARHQGKPEYRERAREYGRAYYTRNPEKVLAGIRDWKDRNPERVAAIRDRRREAERRATPPWWSDWDEFVRQEAADLAKRRKVLTCIPWEMDHLIPIQGREASGLHCADNLQVIPRALNHWKKHRLVLTERGEWIKRL